MKKQSLNLALGKESDEMDPALKIMFLNELAMYFQSGVECYANGDTNERCTLLKLSLVYDQNPFPITILNKKTGEVRDVFAEGCQPILKPLRYPSPPSMFLYGFENSEIRRMVTDLFGKCEKVTIVRSANDIDIVVNSSSFAKENGHKKILRIENDNGYLVAPKYVFNWFYANNYDVMDLIGLGLAEIEIQ